jgi:nucleotide-binding universal stress UspA family protein
MKILLPVDGSDCTRRMIAYLGAHEELFGTRHQYVMLLAIQNLPANVAALLDAQAVDEYCNREIGHVFAPLRAFAGQNGWDAKFETVKGDAGAAIASYAEQEKPDLIVMGSHGRTALANVVMGSVATSVLARCKIPTLLIR